MASLLPLVIAQSGGNPGVVSSLLPLILPSLMTSMGEAPPMMQMMMMQMMMKLFSGGSGHAGGPHHAF